MKLSLEILWNSLAFIGTAWTLVNLAKFIVFCMETNSRRAWEQMNRNRHFGIDQITDSKEKR